MNDKLVKLYQLKDEIRAHSEIFETEDKESVADHSWGVAFLTLVYGEETDLDMEKMLKMALLHDLAEAKIGDIAHRPDQNERKDKHDLEEKEWENIAEELSGDLLKVWEEYESRDTDEAIFVKDMDLLDLAVQSLRNEKDRKYDPDNTESDYPHLDEIFTSVENRLRNEKSIQVFSEIKKEYEKAKESRQK